MFRKADNHKATAFISTKGNEITFMQDDGWENLLDSRMSVKSEGEARHVLEVRGYEEFDPNADLKAKGMKWNGYCYA